MRIHVGCSGWFYSHWRGVFYPPQEPTTRNWFGYYANVFGTVELNAPFYRWPSAATVRRWKRDAPPAFLYSVKVNQRITHELRMVRTKRLVQSYFEIAPALGEKMGCFLFQFPPSYHYSASRLKSIVTQLESTHRSVVEFRHRSWWRDSVYRGCADRGIAFCAVSAPRLPAIVPPYQRWAYVRLSGVLQWYRHDYSSDELNDWLNRIRSSGAEEAYVYFNNDRQGFAIKNALMFRRLVRTHASAENVKPGAASPRKHYARDV